MVTQPFGLDYDTPRVPEEDPNIFYPDSDDEPMAEDDRQRRVLIDVSEALIQHYGDRPDVYVSADIFVYYEMNNPDCKVAPDVLVSFGVEDRERLSYFVWRDGKPPDFVLEVASPSTWHRDANEKHDIYAAMGVTEYWRFDPNRGQIFRRVLIGERLNESGEYGPITISESEGALTGHSAVLGLDLFARDGALRMYDPASQTWLRNFREEIEARRIAEERAQTAEDRAALLESILREHGIKPPNGG
jgi:Uma2 family endonuclease